MRRPRGFTLIELVAAFAIFAIGVGVALSIASGALAMARRSATYTEAALLAQSKLDELGHGVELEEGSDSGDFDDERYSWDLDVSKLDPPEPTFAGAAAGNATGGIAEQIPVELFRVELVVRWEEGRVEREARFVTMRAVQPSDAGGSVGVPPVGGGAP